MPFLEKIITQQSLSVVGLAKNVGKTETLNYILRRLCTYPKKIAITSIGVDGESSDVLYNTPKPEIDVYEGMVFATAERFFHTKQMPAEILSVSERTTSLGRLVVARAKTTGRVLLAGPPDTCWLKTLIDEMPNHDIDLTLVDGALSRLSLGSPAVSDSIVLATGAAVSISTPELVRKTKFIYDLLRLPEVDARLQTRCLQVEQGMWALDSDNQLHNLNIPSVLLLSKYGKDLFRYGNTFFISGMISEGLLKYFAEHPKKDTVKVIASDFTKIFTSPKVYADFVNKGGELYVLQQTKLIAITVNPLSPQGFMLNSKDLCGTLSDALEIPVYDIKKL